MIHQLTLKLVLGFLIFHVPLILFPQNNTSRQDTTRSDKTGQQPVNDNSVPQPATIRSSPGTNPDISAIGDFQGAFLRDNKNHFNAGINEAEVSLQSVVDPYARADIFFSFGKDPITGRFNADVEEAYLTTLSLPAHLQLRVGKFRGSLGRINSVHPHALPFVNEPVGFRNYFGEGINSEGASLSWLIPNPVFYQELTFQLTDGVADNPSYIGRFGSTWLKLLHLKNFFDLTSNATLEAGITGISGTNFYDLPTNIIALDLTYKWKPVQFNTYKSFTWQSEAWLSNADTLKGKHVNTFGMYSLINFQVSKRWQLTGMYSYSNRPYSTTTVDQSYSLTLGWYATEFQKIELEGISNLTNTGKNFYQVVLRWIFVIGTHGAHQY